MPASQAARLPDVPEKSTTSTAGAPSSPGDLEGQQISSRSDGILGQLLSHPLVSRAKDLRRNVTVEAALASRWSSPIDDDPHPWMENSTPVRKCMGRILNSTVVEAALGIVIMFNFVLIIFDIDSRAKEKAIPPWQTNMELVFIAIYLVEFMVRVFVERERIFDTGWNIIDLVVLITSLVDVIASLAQISMGSFSMFRILRMMRAMRILRLFSKLRELRKLMQMMACCMKTLFWSFLFTFMAMTVWAALAVEFVHPVIVRLEKAGTWDGCSRCERAFASVMAADITFFQTIIAGDSWGLIAVPVIEESPSTAFIFVGSLLTLIFGVLNLVIAVVVDTTYDMRSKDFIDRGQEMDWDEIEDKKRLRKMFKKIDANSDGAVNYTELASAARQLPEFRHRLRVMDIDSQDLKNLFCLLDQDGSGDIDQEEFLSALHRLQTADTKTTTKFIKYMMLGVQQKQEEAQDELDRQINHLKRQAEAISKKGDSTSKMLEKTIVSLSEYKEELKGSLDNHGSAVQRALEQALTTVVANQAQTVNSRLEGEVHAAIDDAFQEYQAPPGSPESTELPSEDGISTNGPRNGPLGPRGRSRMPSTHPPVPLILPKGQPALSTQTLPAELASSGAAGLHSNEISAPVVPSAALAAMDPSGAGSCGASAQWARHELAQRTGSLDSVQGVLGSSPTSRFKEMESR